MGEVRARYHCARRAEGVSAPTEPSQRNQHNGTVITEPLQSKANEKRSRGHSPRERFLLRFCRFADGRPSAVFDGGRFPFYHHRMEFEEFVPAFGDWYGGGKMTACLVGIRTDESLNRWRTIAGG